MSWDFVNGKFVKSDTAVFTANDRLLRYGDGFFESIKVAHGVPLHFNLHFSRIEKSIMLLQMEFPLEWTQDYFNGVIVELCKKNACSNARIRIVFYRDTNGSYMPEDKKTGFLITVDPLNKLEYPCKEIANLGIYKQMYKTTNFTSILKTTSANIYVMAKIFAKENGHGDCLLVNEKDLLCEATSSNLFMVKGNKLITPPISEYCVDGIMRKVILQLATAYGYDCQESIIEEQDLYLADELFLTNAINGIIPVKDFKGREYGFAYTNILIKMLNDSLKG
jgi:branched-chain amino acid aminotransferase